jgi:hypothetical protein
LDARIEVSEDPDHSDGSLDLEVEIEFPQPRLPQEPS